MGGCESVEWLRRRGWWACDRVTQEKKKKKAGSLICACAEVPSRRQQRRREAPRHHHHHHLDLIVESCIFVMLVQIVDSSYGDDRCKLRERDYQHTHDLKISILRDPSEMREVASERTSEEATTTTKIIEIPAVMSGMTRRKATRTFGENKNCRHTHAYWAIHNATTTMMDDNDASSSRCYRNSSPKSGASEFLKPLSQYVVWRPADWGQMLTSSCLLIGARDSPLPFISISPRSSKLKSAFGLRIAWVSDETWIFRAANI